MFINPIEIGGTMNINKYLPAEQYSLIIWTQFNCMAKCKFVYLKKNISSHFCVIGTVIKWKWFGALCIDVYIHVCVYIHILWNKMQLPEQSLGVQTGACQMEDSRQRYFIVPDR